jgi:hypothetical protein
MENAAESNIINAKIVVFKTPRKSRVVVTNQNAIILGNIIGLGDFVGRRVWIKVVTNG